MEPAQGDEQMIIVPVVGFVGVSLQISARSGHEANRVGGRGEGGGHAEGDRQDGRGGCGQGSCVPKRDHDSMRYAHQIWRPAVRRG